VEKDKHKRQDSGPGERLPYHKVRYLGIRKGLRQSGSDREECDVDEDVEKARLLAMILYFPFSFLVMSFHGLYFDVMGCIVMGCVHGNQQAFRQAGKQA